MSRFLNKAKHGLTPYTPGEQPQGLESFVKLNTNESPFPPSHNAVEAVIGELNKLNLYPDPSANKLIKAVSEFYGANKNQVAVFNGSDELLSFCFQCFCDKGAVFADITYGFYPVYAEVFNIKTHIIPLREDFTINISDYADEKGTIFIANPNATVGLALDLSEIEKLLAQNTDRLVVVDEAYVDFGTESAVSLLSRYTNLLVVQTMSKSRNFAGARLGIAVADEELISDLNRIRCSFNPYNVNRLTLSGAAAAFNDGDYFEKCRAKIIENREFLIRELKNIGFFVTDSKANFVMAGCPEKISGKKLYEKLKERKILVRHFSGARISAFVRITVGTREQLEFLITNIKEILKETNLISEE